MNSKIVKLMPQLRFLPNFGAKSLQNPAQGLPNIAQKHQLSAPNAAQKLHWPNATFSCKVDTFYEQITQISACVAMSIKSMKIKNV